ncbi:MAG TPA: aldo/keto reductase [Vicinamibacteria bacterium]|nr:aldo/keto reductase [Vicinamibacteria bacterium]
MSEFSRRDFLRGTLATGLVAGSPGWSRAGAAAKRSASDWVALGSSGVRVTRLAFGTGTFGGKVQRELGQERFTRLVRHAYDRGIRFFESADAYDGMHEMLASALRGLPRDSYRLMTKYRLRETGDPTATIDRFRRELESEYFDVLLLHCVRVPDWAEQFKRLRDALSLAKEKKVILSHGASCHGLLPLRAFPASADWLDVALLRVNPVGVRMDTLKQDDTDDLGDVSEVVGHLKAIRARGTGVIGMKVMGEGLFRTPQQREASIRFVTQLGAVDAITIGYKSEAEIDEAIERLDTHLNA